jgi:hypothetical protein
MNDAICEFNLKYKDNPQIDHVVDFLSKSPKYKNKKTINFSYEEALFKADEWTKELNKKNKDLKSSGEVENILTFNKGYILVRLIDQESKNWEGLHMGHCVASYKDHEGIYSLRDKSNLPKCTIEITRGYVNQIKGKSNGKIAPEYIEYVLESIKYFNYKINDRDIENVGYIPLSKDIEHSFTNLKIITLNNKQYFYTGNQLKLSVKPIFNNDIFVLIIKIGQSFEYIEKALLDSNVDPSCFENYAIRISSGLGNVELVKMLISNPRVDPSDSKNQAIRGASYYGHTEIVKILLKDPRVDPSDLRNQAMHCASAKGHAEIVKILLKDPRVDSRTLLPLFKTI